MGAPDSFTGLDIESLIEDQPEQGLFRVDRAIHTDARVFELELERIFERSWVYLCHESEIRTPGEYVTATIGRQPVFVDRKKDGTLGCFINVCSHRGTILAPLRHGKVTVFTCRFHGWAYGTDGKCIKIKNEEGGAYPGESSCRERYALKPIARLESYRGFVFGSLSPDVPPLEENLGPAARWIDLLADQSPDGLEVLPGESTYVIRGNWKMGGENSVDGYHVSTVHRVFAAAISKREQSGGYTGVRKTESGRITGTVKSGSVHFGNGHTGVWARRETPEAAPLYEAKERLERTFPAAKVDWMLNTGRNLYLFPNVLVMDNPSTQIRTIKPLSADRAEVRVQCVAPVGESAAAREGRLRKFLDFYLSTGMATSDDVAALEYTHLGNYGRLSRWNEYLRGMTTTTPGLENPELGALGCAAPAASPSWDHETLYHGFYRYWRQLMRGG